MKEMVGGIAVATAAAASNRYTLGKQKKPLAIAMWDFSWILRHHRCGEFENWDQVLDELAERGYNAIRMDSMPHLVAPGEDGKVVEEFYFRKDSWKPAIWGNNYSTRIRPREALVEFIPKCRQRGIHVGLATWFIGPEQRFTTGDGLFQAWDGTLAFLEKHGLLDRVLYVDVLNEYPMWHGFDWLKKGVEERADIGKFRERNPDANIPAISEIGHSQKYNVIQKEFFNHFLTNLLHKLKQRRPQLEYFASLDSGMPLEDIDLSEFQALDYHLWFNHNREMAAAGLSRIGALKTDNDFESAYRSVREFWRENRPRMVDWMSGRIRKIAARASGQGIPCGNTEGWGPIIWMEHPALDWDWVKESGEICVDLAVQNGYKFICTSNFTHPQFPGLWRDVKWHRKLTGAIRRG